MQLKENDKLTYFVVVNFNAASVIEECLDSLQYQDYRAFKILVVDNKSSDCSTDLIRQKYPFVNLITLKKNSGFARANNIAIHAIMKEDPEYIAFINPDAVLDPTWLSSLIQFVRDYQYDFGQSLIMRYDQRKEVDSCGIGISKNLSIYDRKCGDSILTHSRDEAIFGPCFAAALFKRKVIASVKRDYQFFDEEFFTFYEDVDFCFRANFNGLKAGLFPKALCWHRRSFTANKYPFRKYYFIARNYLLILGKHIPLGIIMQCSVKIILSRMALLLKSMRHPLSFLGFLTGSFVGILKAFQKIIESPYRKGNRTAQKVAVLEMIKKDFYE